MTLLERFYPESRFGGFSDIDGSVLFYARVHSLLRPDSIVIDFGCGHHPYSDDAVEPRRLLRRLNGPKRRVIGVDVDEAARSNTSVDEFRHFNGAAWPVETNSADLCLSDFVLEHLEDPQSFFSECARVLRPGGYVCIRTPNAWSYVALAARVIPTRFHKRILRTVQPARHEANVFPAFYRCNSIPRIRRALTLHGFDAVVYGHEAEPSYLGFSSLVYRLGVMYQRWSPGFLRTAIFAFGQFRKR